MNKLMAYVYDFLSIAIEDVEKDVKEIILFGSVARNDFDKDSDIDIFFNLIDTGKTQRVEESIRNSLKSFELKAEKTWNLKRINMPINFIVGSLDDKKWSGIKGEISSSGVLLYGSYKELPDNTNHFYLFNYSLKNLKRKDKMKFIRHLFGYSIKKGKKEYIQKGFLDEIKGSKLASNVILVDVKFSKKVKEIFSKYKVKYKVSDIWIRE